jgi:hypothetical protein
MSEKQKKNKEEKLPRRKFLTTTGALAAGAAIATSCEKQPLPILSNAKLEEFKARILKKNSMKFKTPVSKKELTLKELKSKKLVKDDIEGLVNQIVAYINEEKFTEHDLTNSLDGMHQYRDFEDLSLNDEMSKIAEGMIMDGHLCFGKDVFGRGCGTACIGNNCGNVCAGSNCGSNCPRPDFDQFVGAFEKDEIFTYLDPAVYGILEFHTAEITRMVTMRLGKPQTQTYPE